MEAAVAHCYEIQLAGILPTSAWDGFEGLSVSVQDCSTVLSGLFEDQAALRRIFGRMELLGAELSAVRRLEPGDQPPERLAVISCRSLLLNR